MDKSTFSIEVTYFDSDGRIKLEYYHNVLTDDPHKFVDEFNEQARKKGVGIDARVVHLTHQRWSPTTLLEQLISEGKGQKNIRLVKS